jgi:hypothetical protein
MNYVFRRDVGRTIEDSLRTSIIFPDKGTMAEYLKMRFGAYGGIELLPHDTLTLDHRSDYWNDGDVMVGGERAGYYSKVANVYEQQMLIEYLAGKIAAASNGLFGSTNVTAEQIIAGAEDRIDYFEAIMRRK